ncbi:RusA family crossover junction endodeoxyribonuclease [Ornithinibacillus sp. L9]|uniref:RusA family crossover junction endodeoxyribonuclease n=1 Tax=Ornithinibacillus caprae TaxID=2678566 RepID=A0A6N8FIR8_9BACI|nr:RusA family crossover junction endodeoxyribonuclease [Ornithinibacillus caprae]MUK89131.1 RusA family crossover junction endodeoxyribonuclease [Ornithinibacillus caprae]
MIELTIPGRPVPAVRMTKKSKHVNKYAIRYLQYKTKVGWIAKQHLKEKPSRKPIEVKLKLYLAGGNQGDIDNYFKAITDSLNKIVYEDDRQIKKIDVEKIESSKDEERAEIQIYELVPMKI